jgi:hypothetical protein
VPKFIYPARTTSDTLQLSEITQGTYKTFAKMLLNNDIKCLNIFLNKLIDELSADSVLPDNLNIIDKLVLLLDARCYSISPTIDLAAEIKKEKHNYQLNINDVIDSILELKYKKEFIYQDKSIICKATLPRQLSYDTPEDIFTDSITYLELNKEEVKIDYPLPQKKTLINTLPPILLTRYLKFVEQVDNSINTIEVVKLPPAISQQTYAASILGSNISQLFNLCFYLDLATTHQNEYQLIRNFNFTIEQINNTPPVELSLYYKYITAEAAAAKEEQDEKSSEHMRTSHSP